MITRVSDKVRKKRYAMRRRMALYTRRNLCDETSEATGIALDIVEKVLDYSQAILWERLCQYDRAESPVGMIAIARTRAKVYEVRLIPDEKLTLKVNVLMSELED